MARTPEEIEQQFQLARESPTIHFQTCVMIEDAQKQLIKPKSNVFQRRLDQAYEVLLPIALALGLHIRILGLKIRQCGGSTKACHLIYHHSQRFATDSVILTDITSNSAAMLSKLKLFDRTERLPGWGHSIDAKNVKVDWPNGGACEITSAESKNPGISRTRQFGLFSEACKYPRGGEKDDKAIMASALPSLRGKGTVVIAESTPDGASGWFFEQWHGNKEQPGALTLDEFLAELEKGNMTPGNGWVKVFAAWWEFEENVIQLNDSEKAKIDRTLKPREREGREKYGWTHEQIAWRRATMRKECGGSEELYDEYYPEDDVTCFLSSGRPRFNMASLVRMEKQARGYDWQSGQIVLQDNGSVSWARDMDGHAPFLMLEPPMPGCRYIGWCDPSTGEDQQESNNPDRTSIGMLRVGYMQNGQAYPDKVVCRVRAPFNGETDLTAQYIEAMSRYYGDAMFVLEINMGLHVLEHLKNIGVPVYKRPVFDPHDRDGEQRYMFGWKLKDRDQRRTVIDCLAIAIRDGTIDLAEPHIIAEAKTFVWSKNGREEARAGCKDDDILGLAMAEYCKGSATLYSGPTRKTRRPVDAKQWKRWRG